MNSVPTIIVKVCWHFFPNRSLTTRKSDKNTEGVPFRVTFNPVSLLSNLLDRLSPKLRLGPKGTPYGNFDVHHT